MDFAERVYSVLLVSAGETFNASVRELLPAAQYASIHAVCDAGAARRELLEHAFDLVLINAPLPDESGVRLATDAAELAGTTVLLLVKGSIFEELCDKMTAHGVFLLTKPTARATMQQALGWLTAARERLRKLEQKTLSVEEKMAEIRTVNRAKWLLIDRLKMTEPDAHRYIEKQAMDRSVSKREIAENIIKTYM